MDGQPQRGHQAPGLAAAVAGAIEASLQAKLEAEGGDPLPREGAAARDRRRRLLEVAEGVVERLESGSSLR
jgi:hypothetical protein